MSVLRFLALVVCASFGSAMLLVALALYLVPAW